MSSLLERLLRTLLGLVLLIFLILWIGIQATPNGSPRRVNKTEKQEVYESPEGPIEQTVDPEIAFRLADADHEEELIFAYIDEVLDGDTVRLWDERGRHITVGLHGIDAPERSELFGREATDQLNEFATGKVIYLELRGTDDNGQKTGILYSNEEEPINLKLLKSGLARHDAEHDQSTDFAGAERAAREARIGIWSQEYKVRTWNYGHSSRRKVRAPATPTVDDQSKAISRKQVQSPAKRTSNNHSEPIVYVTEYGSKYHRGWCQHLAKSKQQITLSRARGSYGPCKDCQPPH